jgi:hypothetical protein
MDDVESNEKMNRPVVPFERSQTCDPNMVNVGDRYTLITQCSPPDIFFAG